MRDLKQIQHWMQAVIMCPDGIEAGMRTEAAREQIPLEAGELKGVILPSRNLTSEQRLQIYGNAYFSRLLECLRGEFPALQHALGEQAFDGFCFSYLQRYPSTSYTLHQLAARFPQYLQETRPPGEDFAFADFLIDLARLERIYSDVFDGPGIEQLSPLTVEDLQRIPPARWPSARLVPAPCLRIETFRFPVHEYATAVRQRENEETEIPYPDPEFTRLAITRREFIVRRLPISEPQHLLLQSLIEGKPIEESLRHTVETSSADPEGYLAEIQTWFQTWATLQFFIGVEWD